MGIWKGISETVREADFCSLRRRLTHLGRPGCCSSPASHPSTGPSGQVPGTPTPPERSLWPRLRMSPHPGNTNRRVLRRWWGGAVEERALCVPPPCAHGDIAAETEKWFSLWLPGQLPALWVPDGSDLPVGKSIPASLLVTSARVPA